MSDNTNLKLENKRLRKALLHAWVGYDSMPYQMGDDECDRLLLGTVSGLGHELPRAGAFYRLDEAAVEDIATRETWEELEAASD